MKAVAAMAAACLATAACSETVVEVSVDVRAGIEGLAELEVVARNDGESASTRFDVEGRSFPLTFTVTPEGRSGELVIELLARDAQGQARGAAAVFATIAEGETVALSARLDPADFVVNTTTAGVQRPVFRPGRNGRQIAGLSGGGFAVSFVNDCQNPGSCNVFVRRFDGEGRPVALAGDVTDEVAANSGSYSLVSVPAVAGLETGELAVAWEISDAVVLAVLGTDGGTALSDTPLDPVGADDAVDPFLAPLAGGGAAATWSQDRIDAANPAGIYHAVYSGGAAGAPILVRDASVAETPAVAQLASGQLAIAWAEASAIRVAFTAPGEAPSGELVLRGYEDGSQARTPVLAPLGDRLVAGWSATVPGDPRFEPAGLMIGVFDAAGERIAERLLAGPASAASDTPAVATDASGRVAAAWHDCGERGDGDGCGVFLQLFDADLEPLAPPVRVNTTTADDQLAPSVAPIAGGFAVVWTDLSGAPPDDSTAVRARPIYVDALVR